MDDTRRGVEVGRFGVEIGRWWQRLRSWRRTPTQPPVWHAPQPEAAGSGRHQRREGGVVVAHKLRDGRVVRHYSLSARDETLTTMVRPVEFGSSEVDRTELVPFRPVREADCW